MLLQLELLAARAGAHRHAAGKGDERDGVGDDHELVEHVGELPNQVVGQKRAQEDEHQGDDRERRHGLLAEQILDVDLGEQVPADDGREREEQQTDGYERRAQVVAEQARERQLGHVGLIDALVETLRQRAVAGVEDGDGDQRGDGDDDERVHEHGDHRDDALLMRVLHIGQRMRVRGRAHARLVGEQAALGALRQRGDDAEGDAADRRLRVKGALEDKSERIDHMRAVRHEHRDTADQIDDGHDGNQLLGDGGDARNAAEEDEPADQHDRRTHDPRRDAESGVARRGDRVRLDHAAHEAEGQDNGNGEETGEEPAERAGERRLYVVDRAAVHRAVRIDDARLLGENRLGVVGRHTEERDEPHPEDRARAADEDRAAGTDDVARADLRRDGGGERLERAHAAFLLASA